MPTEQTSNMDSQTTRLNILVFGAHPDVILKQAVSLPYMCNRDITLNLSLLRTAMLVTTKWAAVL